MLPLAPPDLTRVLVADASEVNADLIRNHLESRGYEVDWATDGDHALAMAATGVYQVMLLDIHMPVYGGAEVMRRLHLLVGRKLRVIAVAVNRPASLREELMRMGIDGYLTKPLDFERLDSELARVLGRTDR